MRILFLAHSRLGDAVLSTGLLRHLLDRHPEARITIACGPVAEGVFARMPNRERTIILRKRRFGLHWLPLWAECVGTRWDLVVDLRGSAFAFLVPARRRAVMRGGRRPGHRLLHLAETLGLSPAPRPVAWWSAADEAAVAPLLPSPSGFLVLAPTASQRAKMWPAERFAALAQALTAPDGPMPGAAIGVIAGPGEAERRMAAPLLAALPGARDLVGNLPIPEAAALLSRAGLFVGNDSGLMHLAAATGAPTLGLFGPTHASQYAPVGPRAQAVLAEGPEGETPMVRLPVAEALAAAKRVLAMTEGRQHAGAPAGTDPA
ncbi:MAG: glycosyltransferase family 9 protein [Acetobacteraceae bacterium]|nr:glycosyltransferase family 9 protein [Acetobacteraceae bacterium]MDW8397006.1 glycosyltransferase family 9 protein [Acetobacteraceae bacterium]